MGKLTDKQKAFCEQYIADMNATEAAGRAGYSAHTAKQQGHRLLTTPVCRQEIDRLLAERQQKTAYNRIRAERELGYIHQRALEKGDLASAVAAVREKKKLFGLDQEEKAFTINVKLIVSLPERRQQLLEELRLIEDVEKAGTVLVIDTPTGEGGYGV